MKPFILVYLLTASDLIGDILHIIFVNAATTTSPSTAYCEYVPGKCWMSNDTNCLNPRWPDSPYLGSLNTTIYGYSCQTWASDTPNLNYFHYTGNECRDPDGTLTPWCYTTDFDVRWDLCFQPQDSCGGKI